MLLFCVNHLVARLVAASIRFVRGEDAEDVRRFPAPRSPDAPGFIADLEATVAALFAAAERLDIANFSARWPGRDPHP